MKRLLKLAAGLVGLFALVVVISFVGVRHRPWSVPEDMRPAKELRGRAPQGEGQGLTVRFLGVSGYEITDGRTVVLVDPTPTRPPPSALLTGPLSPDEVLGAKECPRADFILVNHTHFDHALDVPAIAKRTGATVMGSQSTVNLALSRGVAKEKTRVVHPGEHLTLGTFSVDVRGSRHTDIAGISNPMGGLIAPDAGPLWFWQFTQDQTLAYRFEAGGASLWFHPTSTFAKGEIGGPAAETLIVGVTGEKLTPEKLREELGEAKPKRVLPTHYDNFFQPFEKGLALMPGCDLEAARAAARAVDPKVEWLVLDYDEEIHLPPDARN